MHGRRCFEQLATPATTTAASAAVKLHAKQQLTHREPPGLQMWGDRLTTKNPRAKKHDKQLLKPDLGGNGDVQNVPLQPACVASTCVFLKLLRPIVAADGHQGII